MLNCSGIYATICIKMSSIEKLIEKITNKPTPNDITKTEIIRVAKYYGCTIIPGGKHPIKICDIPSGTIVVIPIHGKNIKEAYITELCLLFDTIKTREKKEEK